MQWLPQLFFCCPGCMMLYHSRSSCTDGGGGGSETRPACAQPHPRWPHRTFLVTQPQHTCMHARGRHSAAAESDKQPAYGSVNAHMPPETTCPHGSTPALAQVVSVASITVAVVPRPCNYCAAVTDCGSTCLPGYVRICSCRPNGVFVLCFSRCC